MKERDTSHGVSPVRATYDIYGDGVVFDLDGKKFSFDLFTLPFTLKEMTVNGQNGRYADRELILKHLNKAERNDVR